MDAERPTVYCLVAIEILPGVYTEPALVSLELAAELHDKGYAVVGPDPEDIAAVEEYDRARRYLAIRRKWFEVDDGA